MMMLNHWCSRRQICDSTIVVELWIYCCCWSFKATLDTDNYIICLVLSCKMNKLDVPSCKRVVIDKQHISVATIARAHLLYSFQQRCSCTAPYGSAMAYGHMHCTVREEGMAVRRQCRVDRCLGEATRRWRLMNWCHGHRTKQAGQAAMDGGVPWSMIPSEESSMDGEPWKRAWLNRSMCHWNVVSTVTV